jgi:fluoride exporter
VNRKAEASGRLIEPSFTSLALVAIGGAVGGIARHAVSTGLERRLGSGFPWGTLAVNVSGAAAIGLLAGIMLANGGLAGAGANIWAALAIGVLGSYTTVSSFTLQTLTLRQTGNGFRAASYVVLSLVLCLGAASAAYLAVG